MSRTNLKLGIVTLMIAAGSLQPVNAQLIAGRSDNGESAVYIDVNSGTPTPLFNLTDNGFAGSGVEGLTVNDANRIIYVCSGATVPDRQWILGAHYDDRDFNDPSRIRLKKIVDLSPFIRLSGLAWNSTTNKLYAAYPFSAGGPEGIYEINLTTGAATLVYDFTSFASSIDVRGFDFNPADGLLYGTDLATTAPGRSLISINLAGPSITEIAGAGVLTSVESGLAIGNGRAYLVPDDDNTPTANPIRVYNLTTNLYETPIATSFTTDRTSAGAGWGPNALVVPAGSNLATTVSATPTNALEYPVNTQINYTVKFANFGPTDATNVNYSIVLSGSASATISNVVGGNAVEGPTGTITGSEASIVSGQQFTVTFTATTTGAGTLTATASIPQGGNLDPYLGNNTEALSHGIRVYPATNVVFTTVQSSPKSDVPGTALKFPQDGSTTLKFRKPYRSPNGNFIGLWSDTNDATATDEIYLRKDPGGSWAIAAREGITATTNADLLGAMILTPVISLNNSGQYAIANDTNASPNDETIIVFDGTNHVAVAREAGIIPAFSTQGYTYSSTMDSPSIDGAGRAAFRVSSMGVAATAVNQAILADNGTRVLSQKGVTVPAGQAGGATNTWEVFDADTLYIDCLGLNWMVHGDTNAATTADDILVVNGTVVLQQGEVFPGLTGTVPEQSGTAGVIFNEMYGNGDWYAHGTTSVSTEDWVIKGQGTSFSILAKWGDNIHTGTTEKWSDVDGFSATFFHVSANSQGDYVICGRTDNSNVSKNAVAVLNGTTELFREGDRVDLDINGIYDDDAFIDTFGGQSGERDFGLVTDSGDFYAPVNLRNGAGTFIGKAFLMIHFTPAPVAGGADLLVTKSVSDDSLDALGQQTVFTVRVCNKGPADATGVTMTDTIPSGLDFISATNGAVETAPNSNIVTASIPSLPSCNCQSFDITVQAVAPGTFNNTASASGAQADPVPGNNSGSASVTVTAVADLSVTKVDNGGAPVGQNFVYTITITNNGPAPATNVLMTDNLDPTTTFVSATNGAIQSSPGVVTRTFASLANGASEVVQITVTGTVQSLVTNQVTVDGAEDDPDANNNTDIIETVVGDVADVSVTLSDPGLQVTGSTYAYTLTVLNDGPAPATNVQVTATVPAGLSVVSLTNGAVENPPASGNITATFASIASQASQVIVITVNAPTPGTYTVSALAGANEVDIDDLNNSAQVITRVGDFSPVRAIYTQIAGDPTSNVPGLLDANDQPIAGQFDSMLNINVSMDGSRWTMEGASNITTAIDGVMMLGSGFTGTMFAQEGKQAFGVPAGTLYTFFDDDVGFNSSNDFAWGALTSVTANSDVTYTNIAGVNANIAQTGSTVNGLQAGSGTINNSTVSQHLLDDGRVGFNASNISGSRAALAYWDSVSGINVFVERNVTSVDGDLITGLPVDRIFYTTPNGLHTLYRATIAGGSMLVYDGGRVLRTGDALPDASGTINAVNECHMSNNGSWISRGDKVGGDDWVIRNGAMVAATGQSIEGGSEAWGNLIGTVRVNDNGDYLVSGNTNIGDNLIDGVLTVNGDVIVRESDPVDLNGNGLFDDNIYITSFSSGNVWLSNDLKIHFLATIRNGEGTSLSTAFLVVDLGACQTLLGDANGSGGRNGRDTQSFVNCLFSGNMTHPCKCADMDNDGDIDSADATLFATALVGDP